MLKKINFNVCEVCEKETRDIKSEIGWIKINIIGMVLFLGKMSRHYKSNTWINDKPKEDMDFCSKKCLFTFLEERLNNEDE